MNVHARAVHSEKRFGHESCVYPVLGGNLLNRQPVGHDTVSHDESIIVMHVDLVLGRGYLVMGILDFYSQILQRQYGFPAQVGSHVQRS